MGQSHLALPIPLVAMVSVPLLPQNSPRPDNDLYRVPSSCTLYTIVTPRLLGAMSVLVLTSIFPNKNFGPAHGFAELPTLGPVPGFRAATLQPPALLLGLRSSIVTRLSSDMALVMR